MLTEAWLDHIWHASFLLTGKSVLPKNVTSTSKKRAAKNSSNRKIKAKPATLTLAHYFKMKDKADHLQTGGPSPAQKPNINSSPANCVQTVPQEKKTATSLILFEEVKQHHTCIDLERNGFNITAVFVLSSFTGWCHIRWWRWFPCSHQSFHENH